MRKGVISDTNILIDYMETNARLLTCYHQEIEPMLVPRRVKSELGAMKGAMLAGLGLAIHLETVEQLAAARSYQHPKLSEVDKVCLFVAHELQLPCVTNDTALRAAWAAMSVPQLWGFDLMVTLVAQEMLEAVEAIETARQIQHLSGPVYCPQWVVDKFIQDVRKAS